MLTQFTTRWHNERYRVWVVPRIAPQLYRKVDSLVVQIWTCASRKSYWAAIHQYLQTFRNWYRPAQLHNHWGPAGELQLGLISIRNTDACTYYSVIFTINIHDHSTHSSDSNYLHASCLSTLTQASLWHRFLTRPPALKVFQLSCTHWSR